MPLKLKFAVLLLVIAVRGSAEIQFSGYFITPKSALFSLADPAVHAASGWLETGQSFEGYTIVSFDAASETLTVNKDGHRAELHLRDAKVKDGKFVVKGRIMIGSGEHLDEVTATLFLDQESIFPLGSGGKLHLVVHRMEDGNLFYESRFEVRDKDGVMRTIGAPSVLARPGQKFELLIGDLGFSFQP